MNDANKVSGCGWLPCVLAFTIVIGLVIAVKLVQSGKSQNPIGIETYQSNLTVNYNKLYEFNYEGCQYVGVHFSLTHKGNCTNGVHLYNK